MVETVGVVGLGLIGGSLAMALRGFEDFEIVGTDRSPAVREQAAEKGAGDRIAPGPGPEEQGAEPCRRQQAQYEKQIVSSPAHPDTPLQNSRFAL